VNLSLWRTEIAYHSVVMRSVIIIMIMGSEIVMVLGLCHSMRYVLSVIRTERAVSTMQQDTLFESEEITTEERRQLKRFSLNF